MLSNIEKVGGAWRSGEVLSSSTYTAVYAYMQLPELSIFSESYTTGNVEIVALPNGKISGRTVVSLVSKDNGYLSKASFKGLSISPGWCMYMCFTTIANQLAQ